MTHHENDEGKRKFPGKLYYLITAAALVAGIAIGSFWGGGLTSTSQPEHDDSTGDLAGETEVQETEEDGFAEAKPQLQQQLRQEKEMEFVMQHLEDLKNASEIERNLDVFGEGEPGAVVAVVNGEEIKKEEVLAMEEQEKQQLMMMGVEPDSEDGARMMEEIRPQVLNNLIKVAALRQKAEEEVALSEAEVQEQYQAYAEQFGGEEELMTHLEQAGMTKDDLQQEIVEQYSMQVYIQNYLEESVDEAEFQFTDEELKELYQAQQKVEQQPIELEIEGD